MTQLVVEVCRFRGYLGYPELIFMTDGEPSCVNLQERVQQHRLKYGAKTVLRNSPRGDRQANGAVERSVQALRYQCNIFLAQMEEGCKCKVGTFDPLHAWAWLHSAWTHNRFHVVQGMTPLERVSSGSIYRGKVAVFGECVLAYMKVQNKGNPFLGKEHMAGQGRHKRHASGVNGRSRIPWWRTGFDAVHQASHSRAKVGCRAGSDTQRHALALPGYLGGHLEGQGVLLNLNDGEEEQFMEVLPDEAPLVIGFPGDRATGEGDEAASDPETVVPDERTATHEKKGESEDQTEQAANPRKSAFKATDVVQPKVKAAKIEPKVRVVPPESARVRDPAEEERDSKAAKVSPRKERRLNAPPMYAGEPTPGEGGDSSDDRT